MTFAVAHNYLTVHWSVPGVSEQGQFGLRFVGSVIPDQATVDGLASVIKSWWINASTNIQPNYNLVSIKIARVDLNGSYVPGATVWVGAVAQPAAAGGTTGVQFPLQSATVATLRTGVATGLGHSGRIYMPPLSGLLASNQLWSATMVNAANLSLAGLLSTLSGSALGVLTVMSFGNAVITVGPAHTVTGVQTDARPDVQRRRAAQLAVSPGTLAAVT